MGDVKEITGTVADIANIYGTIDNAIMARKNLKETKRQFDARFNEEVRQFGLNYALQDYATRKNISLQQAQQLYNAENLGMAKTALNENMQTSALGRGITATRWDWEKQDRANANKISKATQKGIVMGLFGGK
jgi:hypothetical protein